MRMIIFAGPTGGHFYPAWAFLESFKARRPEAQILFVTGLRGSSLTGKLKRPAEVEFEFLADFPFPRPPGPDFLIRFPIFLLKLARAFLKMNRILERFSPELAVGFGSYVSFPGLVLAHWRKIPTLIHEQNRKIGRANAWALRFSDRIALSFEGEGGRVTGLPLRSSLIRAALQNRPFDQVPQPAGRTRILLVGGSQGSQSINRLWAGVIAALSDEEKSKIAVMHITGKADFGWFEKMYATQGVEAKVFPYHEQMEELYSTADLAITRSGAGTLSELALFHLPAVVLPYPYAEGHQEMNARSYESEGAILLLSEKGCTPERLKESVFRLMASPELRNQLGRNLARLAKPDASEKLVDMAEELL